MNKSRKQKNPPPFYWSFILAVVIIVELVIFINEKIWSHGYFSAKVGRDGGQIEKLAVNNQRLYQELADFYNQIFNNINHLKTLGYNQPNPEFLPVYQLSLKK